MNLSVWLQYLLLIDQECFLWEIISVKHSYLSTEQSVCIGRAIWIIFLLFTFIYKLFVSGKLFIWFSDTNRNRWHSESMAVLFLYRRWCCDLIGCMILSLKSWFIIPDYCSHRKSDKMPQCIKIFYFMFIWSSTRFGLTASSNYTSNNNPRMQNQRLLVQF